MKRSIRTMGMAAAAMVLLHGGATSAHAFGGMLGGHGPLPMMAPMEGPGMLPLPVLLSVMTSDQRQQLRDIMKSDRPAMHQLLEDLRTAHEALADRVFTPGDLAATDLDPQLAKIAQLRDQLVQRALTTTLRVRALLTADQLAEAAKRKQRLGELHAEERQIMGDDVTFDVQAP